MRCAEDLRDDDVSGRPELLLLSSFSTFKVSAQLIVAGAEKQSVHGGDIHIENEVNGRDGEGQKREKLGVDQKQRRIGYLLSEDVVSNKHRDSKKDVFDDEKSQSG